MTRLPLAAAAVVLFLHSLECSAQVSELCKPTLAPRASGEQVADRGFSPRVARPAYAPGTGPRVLLDEAHLNLHTAEGRYAPFADLLRRDGFIVEPNRSRFSGESLASAKILVIANALAPRNKELNWTLPARSAFSKREIDAVRSWVREGGSLLLIADHMPLPGVAADLAREFGVFMVDGFATDRTCSEDEFVFQRSDGTLADHPVTRGRDATEKVDSVRTITGQAFRVSGAVTPVLILAPETVVLLPRRAWEFSEDTPRIAGDGMAQGAVLPFGSGRVAVFGEAAMFSAQVSGKERRPMGMNMPTAAQNAQFLLNVMHWLSRILPENSTTCMALLPGIASSAQVPMETKKPAPELKKLEYFAGTWTTEGTIKPGPMGSGGTFTGTNRVRWMEGGFFLVTHSEFSGAMGKGAETAYMGYDGNDGMYTYDSFNTLGEADHAKGNVNGDTWTWQSETRMGAQSMKGRLTIRVLSGVAYNFKFELSPDGTTWTTALEGKATKK